MIRWLAVAAAMAGCQQEVELVFVAPARPELSRSAELACRDADTCARIATYGGQVKEPILERAIAMFRERCDDGELRGCQRALTLKRLYQAGGDPDGELALERAACLLGGARNCSRAAQTLEASAPDQSLELRWRAMRTTAERCVDTPDECPALTREMHHAAFNLARADPERVAALVEPACESGDVAGCEVLARALGLRCAKGCDPLTDRARRAARARALEIYDGRCDDDEWACVSLGFMHRWGVGGEPPDLPGAIAAVKRGCDRRAGYACLRLASYLLRGDLRDPESSRPADAVALYQRLCEAAADRMTQQAACRSLRRLYQQGDSVSQDPIKAAEYSRRACALGSRTDCPD